MIKGLKAFGKRIGLFFAHFSQGDLITKASYVVMGLGQLLRGQWVKGVAYLGVQLVFIFYMLVSGV